MDVPRNRRLALVVSMVIAAFASFAGASGAGTAAVETAEANGITIAYERSGPAGGPTVLLIAGTGMQLVDWPQPLIDALASEGFDVIRYDHRDLGASTSFEEHGLPDEAVIARAFEAGDPVPAPYDFGDMVDDAIGLLDALDVEEAHVVGMSMGGAIAQLMALDDAKRVASLTLIAADSGDPEAPAVADAEAFVEVPEQPTGDDRDAFIEYWVASERAISSPGYPPDEGEIRERVERSVDRSFDPQASVRQQTVSFVGHLVTGSERFARLSEIDVPTVVVHGEDDPLVPVESAEQIADRIPGAELRVLPG